MPNKVQDVYQPLLNAFKKELIRANSIENITESLIRYLIGCNGKDYYKLVHRKNNKVDVTKEWSISFRIHSASSLVETSLKFDVQLAKHPSSVVCYTSKW